MRNDTRIAFTAYSEQIARLSSVPDATVNFTVDPTIQQKLETKQQESSEFLSRINVYGVVEQEGAKLGLNVSGPIASRTNTTVADRATKDPTGLDETKYRCEKTNFDTHIPYAKLDAWAKFADFQTRMRDVVLKRQALDRMIIGWHGTSVAATTNLGTSPMLQDVNKGWLQHIREDAPARVMDEVEDPVTADQISVGPGGDYLNLDALVYDAITLLDPWAQEDTGLVAIVGRDLLHDKYFPLINKDQAPTETLAADIIISQKRLGGLPAVRVPYFPAGTVLITSYDNLSIYYQEGGRRRRLEDNPKRDRIENYESSNDAYVIEDYGYVALIEKIVIVEAEEV